MSNQWIWAKSDTPPKCTLTKWQKQARVAEAEKLLETFYRPRFILPPRPDRPHSLWRVAFSWTRQGFMLWPIMRELNITDALTTDRHFVEAGFKALLPV